MKCSDEVGRCGRQLTCFKPEIYFRAANRTATDITKTGTFIPDVEEVDFVVVPSVAASVAVVALVGEVASVPFEAVVEFVAVVGGVVVVFCALQ